MHIIEVEQIDGTPTAWCNCGWSDLCPTEEDANDAARRHYHDVADEEFPA